MTDTKIVENARACIQQLQKAGLDKWAKKIIEAIDSGSTGGEIVMAIRWNLNELLESTESIPQPTRKLAQDIIQAINATGW